MKKWRPLIPVVLLITAGCAGPQSSGQPVPAPPQSTPVTVQPAAPQDTAPLPARAVDYYFTGLDAAQQPQLPLTANACRTMANGTRQVQVSEVQWRPHPLAPDKFWAPSAVLTACNGGLTRSGEQSLGLALADGTALGSLFFLPGLEPGQALGPVRLYASAGVPAKVGAFWQQNGELWPSVTLVAAGHPYPVRRALDQAGPEAPGGTDAPAAPTLAQLRALALDSVTFSPDGKRQAELFLYAPDARYNLTDMPSCASMTEQIDADAQHWAFWVSNDGGAPVPAGDAGAYGFPGERGLYKETTTVGGTTYFYLEQYGSCSNPQVTSVFAFDAATNTVWRPQMKLETGQTLGAAGLVGQDGKLHRSYYNNATDDFGYHQITYAWDPQAKLWVTESHERK